MIDLADDKWRGGILDSARLGPDGYACRSDGLIIREVVPGIRSRLDFGDLFFVRLVTVIASDLMKDIIFSDEVPIDRWWFS